MTCSNASCTAASLPLFLVFPVLCHNMYIPAAIHMHQAGWSVEYRLLGQLDFWNVLVTLSVYYQQPDTGGLCYVKCQLLLHQCMLLAFYTSSLYKQNVCIHALDLYSTANYVCRLLWQYCFCSVYARGNLHPACEHESSSGLVRVRQWERTV